MAAFNGLAMVQLQAKLASGQAVRNTFHISKPGSGAPPDYTELLQIATDVATYFATSYKAILTTTDTFVQVLTKQVNDPTAPVTLIEAAYPVAAAGTRSAGTPPSPDEMCAVASLKTPNASRRFRGHLFLPPAKDAALQNGEFFQLTGAYHTAVAAFIALLQTGAGPSPTWTGTSLHAYILSIYSKTAALSALPSVASVQTASSDYRVHWLRSRGRGTS